MSSGHASDSQRACSPARLRYSESHRLHVALWYKHRPQRYAVVTPSRPMYLPYNYMEPLGVCAQKPRNAEESAQQIGREGGQRGPKKPCVPGCLSGFGECNYAFLEE